MEQGSQFKFDKGNKAHVSLLKSAAGNDELAIYPGGRMSVGMKASPQIEAQKNSKSKPAAKAVAPKKAPAKKLSNFEKATLAVEAAKKRGDIK